jgi:ABC-type Mn2+/Zn2+ transport system permease subunit
MEIALTWILGAIAGSVLWSAFLRLPGHLARWLCAPYDNPGRVAMAVSMLASVIFLALIVVGALLGLSLMIGSTVDADNAKKLRETLFLSSILGYAVVPVLIRIERSFTSRRKP